MTDTEPQAAAPRRKRGQPAQDPFWADLRDRQAEVSIYLVNGLRLHGTILAFDDYTVLLSDGPTKQLLRKHAISSVMPAQAQADASRGHARLHATVRCLGPTRG